MNKIKLPNVPEPKGHYSSAVVHNGLIFVSGQLPRNAVTGEVETGAIELQTELALRNVEDVLKAANSDLNHVCILASIPPTQRTHTALCQIKNQLFCGYVGHRFSGITCASLI